MTKNAERAKYIKKQREERAWSQTQLAELAGVDPRTIQRLEKDGSAYLKTMNGVAKAFGVDVKQLSAVSALKETDSPSKRIHFLPRLILGTDLTNLVAGADHLQVEHDDDNDPRSVAAMRDIAQLFRQDLVRLLDANPTERIDVERELSQELQGLEGHGYYLFGIKRIIPRVENDQISLITMATFYMSHSRSPRVVRDKALMAVPATLTEVANKATAPTS